jgi:hypothetical protein
MILVAATLALYVDRSINSNAYENSDDEVGRDLPHGPQENGV